MKEGCFSCSPAAAAGLIFSSLITHKFVAYFPECPGFSIPAALCLFFSFCHWLCPVPLCQPVGAWENKGLQKLFCFFYLRRFSRLAPLFLTACLFYSRLVLNLQEFIRYKLLLPSYSFIAPLCERNPLSPSLPLPSFPSSSLLFFTTPGSAFYSKASAPGFCFPLHNIASVFFNRGPWDAWQRQHFLRLSLCFSLWNSERKCARQLTRKEAEEVKEKESCQALSVPKGKILSIF